MVTGLAQPERMLGFWQYFSIWASIESTWQCSDRMCVCVYLPLWECERKLIAVALSVRGLMARWVSKPALSEVGRCKQPQPWYLEKAKQNAKCISLNWSLYLSKLPIVFVQIARCICPNKQGCIEWAGRNPDSQRKQSTSNGRSRA